MSGTENTEKSVNAESVSRTTRDDTGNVFVVGDVHGNLDRLEALLKQEGFLDRCWVCDGSGEEFRDGDGRAYGAYVDCTKCDGLGWARLRKEVTIVQLGDLGHFGQDGSPTADTLCYKYVTDNRWCDIVLWGNHDRALVDSSHAFKGYLKNYDAMHYIAKLRDEGRMRMAYATHGFLITHAGLAKAFRDQKVDDKLKADPVALADWLNEQDERYLYLRTHLDDAIDADPLDTNALAIINAIGAIRGGRVNTGGILWRDISEKLYDGHGMRQIFGHSADHEKRAVRYCWDRGYTRDPNSLMPGAFRSYCIDIGGKAKHGLPGACLAGIYLPSEKTVRIQL